MIRDREMKMDKGNKVTINRDRERAGDNSRASFLNNSSGTVMNSRGKLTLKNNMMGFSSTRSCCSSSFKSLSK